MRRGSSLFSVIFIFMERLDARIYAVVIAGFRLPATSRVGLEVRLFGLGCSRLGGRLSVGSSGIILGL